jgi:SAM-dependent methyltransferase
MTGRDLLFQQDVKSLVCDAYADVRSGGGTAVAGRLYTAEALASVPAGAVAWSLGVGDPVRHARLQAGERVLDVGAGGGIDSILAARRVGPAGTVIGLDVLPQMCERARRHATEAGVDGWTSFEQGGMEDIPLENGSVEVVISNGVINLSPRKSRVLAEIHRVLAPGGRICIADLTVDDELPDEVMASDAAWAG